VFFVIALAFWAYSVFPMYIFKTIISIIYYQNVPGVLPPGPEEQQEAGGQAYDHRGIDGRVVAEVGVLENVVKVDGVGLHKEAASEEGHVGAPAFGVLIRGLLNNQLFTYFIKMTV
jgi:hypothetical protein